MKKRILRNLIVNKNFEELYGCGIKEWNLKNILKLKNVFSLLCKSIMCKWITQLSLNMMLH